MSRPARGQDKGANGRIAEYACCLFLAIRLSQAGLGVRNNLDQLQALLDQEISKYDRSLSTEQINLAVQAANAMGQHMFDCILDHGTNLIFVDYDFHARDHEFEIEPTGAAQNKGTTDDMIIHVFKNAQPVHQVRLSLKVGATTENSQGSKSAIPALYKMFVDPQVKRVNKKQFVGKFGTKGQEFVDLITEFKRAGKEYWATAEGQAWAQAKYQERLARGKDPKKARVKCDGNFLRSQVVGDYYIKTRKQVPEHQFSQLFVELYNQAKQQMTPADWSRFNAGFAQAIGFDDVITYKTICNKNGIQVISSSTNRAYQQMYRVLSEPIDVLLEHRPASSGVGVRVRYKDSELKSLSLSVWKDSTIQFKFDSA
jgi:hypothetical protein